jgi:hypothetical protein
MLIRMKARRISMSKKVKDRVEEAIEAGAFVLPPKPKAEQTEPVAEAEPTATKTPDPAYRLVERKPKAEFLPEAMAAALQAKRTGEAG